ncbi:methyltransferase family protein [Pseudonocardia sp.]|uniref:methyltransferase family protein n=1 Tax=Pseudonocardia sp. TaxID=60912 RepID=UPI003D143288
MLFPVAVVLGLAAPVLVLTGITSPPATLTHPAIGVAGLVLAVAGVVLVLVAQAQMGTSWRIGVDEGERTTLVTDGLFHHVRNPIFTGMGAVAAGMLLMVPTMAALLALACLVAALEIQVRVVEEPYLRRTHGPEYAAYAAGSGRFLPTLKGRGTTRTG